MPMFVHLTSENNLPAILRGGISRIRRRAGRPHGIYAMPVTRNFYVSHQWVRELRRWKSSSIVAVYFRIADEEMVWVGHYNSTHQQMTAAEAVSVIMSSDRTEGYEVIVPRRIGKGEIHRVKSLPQVVGWRYFPGSHSTLR